MSSLAEIVSRTSPEATLIGTDGGSAVYLGSVRDLKNTRRGWTGVWPVPDSDVLGPFNRVLIHNGSRIRRVLRVRPFYLDGQKSIKMSLE